MTGIESIALQTGGSLGTLVILIVLLRPAMGKFFDSLIKNQEKLSTVQEKNISALESVSESIKAHDKRAELRASTLNKKIDIVIDKNKEYGEVLVKFYNHVVAQKGKAS